MQYRSYSVVNTYIPPVNRRYTMKYTKDERLDIGHRIYDGEISRYQAAEIYNISDQTARDYMRLYRSVNDLPPKQQHRSFSVSPSVSVPSDSLEELEAMSKEQLITELVKARINEARLKKGYEKKGDGSVILYGKKNTR